MDLASGEDVCRVDTYLSFWIIRMQMSLYANSHVLDEMQYKCLLACSLLIWLFLEMVSSLICESVPQILSWTTSMNAG